MLLLWILKFFRWTLRLHLYTEILSKNVFSNNLLGLKVKISFIIFSGWIKLYMAWRKLLGPCMIYRHCIFFKIDTKEELLFIKESGSDLILAQVYIDGIIFGLENEDLSKKFIDVMSKKFEMRMMSELAFFSTSLSQAVAKKGSLATKASILLICWKFSHSMIASLQRLLCPPPKRSQLIYLELS